MPTAKWIQPVFTGVDSVTYKTILDGCVKILARLAALFAPCAQDTPDMTVRLAPGVIPALGGLALEVAAQSTDSLTAPGAEPRRDIVYIDAASGTVGVATGTEAAVPEDPGIPPGALPVARVSLFVGMTEITDQDLEDLRAGLNLMGLGTGAFAELGTAQGQVPVLGAGGLLDLARLSDMVGDAGAGGTRGLVPAPGAGAATRFLAGDGTWKISGGVPVGTVLALAASAVPAGWLECNGASLSTSTYADLYGVLGTVFGSGSGTFNLPDLRGEFVRGWDHGRGADSGRTFGSYQADDYRSHAHSGCADVDTSHPANVSDGAGYGAKSGGTSASGGSETRPRNRALMFIIKY